MTRRKTIEEVKQAFEEKDYTLLSTEYKDCATKLPFRCPRGHIWQMSWNKFKCGIECAKCFGTHKHSIEYVRQCFEKREYTLLSYKYVNNSSKLKYKCEKGHIGFMSWTNFQQGERCGECYGTQKWTFEEIKQKVEQEGYQLLSHEYVNTHTKIKFGCNKGHIWETTWNFWYNFDTRCPFCKHKQEGRLGKILEQIYPGQVKQHDNLGFLGKKKVDFSIRGLKLAFEYDGKQHFEPMVGVFGSYTREEAVEKFRSQQERDKQKDQLCRESGYVLIRIPYYEKVSVENIKKKIEEQCKKE